MTDIDTLFAQMRNMPADLRLMQIDAAVLDGLEKQLSSQARPSGTLYMLSAVLALIVGIAGSAFPSAPASAASSFPLGAPPMLAPSSLLVSAR